MTNIVEEEGESVAELTYDEKIQYVNAIAEPLAPRKLTKKCYKLVRKAARVKTCLKIGKKDVERQIRRGDKGIVIIAGDVQPIDIISHVPGVCEDNDIPYIYVPSRNDLGASASVKRCIIMALVLRNDNYGDLYDEVSQKICDLSLSKRINF